MLIRVVQVILRQRLLHSLHLNPPVRLPLDNAQKGHASLTGKLVSASTVAIAHSTILRTQTEDDLNHPVLLKERRKERGRRNPKANLLVPDLNHASHGLRPGNAIILIVSIIIKNYVSSTPKGNARMANPVPSST